MLNILTRIRHKIKGYSSDEYIQTLRQKGAQIGKGTFFFSPQETYMDNVKPWLITIGEYCKITSRVTILAHDYSRSVARMYAHENIGGSAPVQIGNNVFIGMGVTILMGTKIGNNCIIGADAVVKGNIPSNSVVAGNPAKVICTLDEYIEKRKRKMIQEAVDCVRHSINLRGGVPTIQEMGDGFAWLYLPRTLKTIEQFPEFFNLKGDNRELVIHDFLNSNGVWESYDDFIKYALSENKN